MLISFSGLDGSGKTTLISSLQKILEERGFRVTVRTMYNDMAFYSFIRKMRDRVVKTFRPNDRDMKLDSIHKNRQLWDGRTSDPKIDVSDKDNYLARILYKIIRCRPVRKMSLFLDLLIVICYRTIIEKIKGSVFITDRYLYDSLADAVDLNDRRGSFVKFFLHLVPDPDVPLYIDVPAEVAFVRKGEYPINYMVERRNAYLKMFGRVGGAVIIPNDDLRIATRNMEDIVMQRIAGQ